MKFQIKQHSDKGAIKDYIDKLSESKHYDVSIVLHRQKRSLDQNRLLFLWINCIASETGNDKDALHTFFKRKFLTPSSRTVFGTQVYLDPTTTSLDTRQFTDYLEHIRAFAASEIGITLPDPEDALWAQFYEQYKDQI